MNTTEFLTAVRDRAMCPADDEDWDDAKFLSVASEELRERYTSVLPNMRAGYWLHRETTTLTNGVAEYRIPARAIAQGLEKIECSVDSGTTWYALNPRTDSQTYDIQNRGSGEPNWFSIEADYIVLYPTPTAGYSLRFSYYLRPSKLRALSALGTVVSTPSASVIRVSGDPTTIIGSSGTLDVVNTSGTNEVALVGLSFSGVASAGGGNYDVTITGGTSLARVAAGQVLRAPDTTDYIPLPVELHESLVGRVAAVYLLDHGDQEQANAFVGKSESSIKRFQDTAQPRVKAQPAKMRSGRGSYLRRRYG